MPKQTAAGQPAQRLAMLAWLLLLLGAATMPQPAHAQCEQCQDYARQLNLLRSRVHMTLFSADQGKTTDSASDHGSTSGRSVVSAQSATAQRDYDTLHARFQLLCGGGGGGGCGGGGGGGEITDDCWERGPQEGGDREQRDKRVGWAIADFMCMFLLFLVANRLRRLRRLCHSPQGHPLRPPAPTRAR